MTWGAAWERQQPHSLRWGGATDTDWDCLPLVVRYRYREYVLPIVVAAAPAIEAATLAARPVTPNPDTNQKEQP